MIINVSQFLLDTIARIEENERAGRDATKPIDFSWTYLADGETAQGNVSNGSYIYKEFSVAVFPQAGNGTVTAYEREMTKYDAEGWDTNPIDSDFEEDN